MSLEDLERAGVLLPQEQWGRHDLHTTVSKPGLAALGGLAAISTVLMYSGDGSFYTWIGAGLFFIALFGLILLSLRAIEKQSQTSERELKRAKKG